MKTAVIGYPRVGAQRELKKATESFFKGEIAQADLEKAAAGLRKIHWETQKNAGIDFISSNDFSFYDMLLDTAYTVNIIPKRYRDLGVNELETYFAMARGYQKNGKDVKALSMKKWFNTNYHYMTPEIDADTTFKVASNKIFDMYSEAKALGLETKPVINGPFTLLKLCRINTGKSYADYIDQLVPVYVEILNKLASLGAQLVQIDEPALVRDLDASDIANFKKIYSLLLAKKPTKILLQTYFGDIRDAYQEVTSLPVDAIGLDFIEGKEKNLAAVAKFGFPKDKTLFAGVINGKNIWVNNYTAALETLKTVSATGAEVVVNTSCSLLHVPFSTKHETKMAPEYKKHLAFAEEKLAEIKAVAGLATKADAAVLAANAALIKEKIENKAFYNTQVRNEVTGLKDADFLRSEVYASRAPKQHAWLKLPVLPTTTIGSFPQTAEVRNIRSAFKKGELSKEQYETKIKAMIQEIVKVQEDIGLDVLVHGEYERNDMVEYFGENLQGFVFSGNGWVQSYGTRCVKPPIVFSDVSRPAPMTVAWSAYTQSLTKLPVKGMLTGPVTILNWSFPREDISLRDIAMQIGLAIRDEVLDLEAAGIKVIQIDEAALREKLPLRRADWHKDYLDWAIPAFRLVHARVKSETQVHTHMCYSEFGDIIKEIEDMDADVITIEAARSDFSLLDQLRTHGYKLEIGPGVYDIHSPRVPTPAEFESAINTMIKKLPIERLWVNPDCGLKTRAMPETVASLKSMVAATKKVRAEVKVPA